MKDFAKRVSVILIAFLLLLNLVVAQVVVQVPTEQKEQKTSWFSFAFLKSPIVLGLIFFLIIVVILGVLLFMIIRFLIKFIKQRADIFYRLRIERIKLAKIHKRYPSKHWWHIERNTPIRLVKKNENNKIMITNPIAYHRGDFIGHEGNMIIALNMVNKKKWFIFPITDILIIPDKEQMKLPQLNKEGKEISKILLKMPTAKDIISFNDNEILLYAEGLSSTGIFYIPVLKSQDGKIIDLSMPTFQSLKEVIVEDFLYNQTGQFVEIARKSVDLNPHVRIEQKIKDANQNVEYSNLQ